LIPEKSAVAKPMPLLTDQKEYFTMPGRKKPIPLGKHEDRLLRRLYVGFKVPTDQFKKRPEDLEKFMEMWNNLAERADAPETILHYMVTKRKAGKKLTPRWPVFGGKHRTAPSTAELLNEKEWVILRQVYSDEILSLGLGTDNLAFRPDLCDLLEQEFARRAGRIVPGLLLAAAIEAKRKRGEWLTLRDDYIDPSIGLKDVDKIN
jgi:hypothetical protein